MPCVKISPNYFQPLLKSTNLSHLEHRFSHMFSIESHASKSAVQAPGYVIEEGGTREMGGCI